MSSAHAIARQADAVARELGKLAELVAADHRAPAGSAVQRANAIEAVESIGRLVDCVRVRVVAPLVREVSFVEPLGYSSPVAAVASLARISERSARARLRVAAAITDERSLTGALVPAPHPLLGEALDSGQIGLDAAALITGELTSIAGRTPVDVLEAAEAVMVQRAAGVSDNGEPMVSSVSVDYLATEIRHVAAAADPDGARPREERAQRRRDFRLGAPDEDGLVPASGKLTPEIGSLLAGLFEARRRSPRFFDPDAALVSADELPFATDPRTPGQRRHDALGEIVVAAAASEGAPRLDGQPVTVLVTVAETDLADESGRDTDAIGTMAGSPFPVSRGSIERFIDAGGYRVVTTNSSGAVIAISSPQRCFTPLHRLGMAARDGLGCSTPGCTSPTYTLQAHHVVPYRDDGPTSLDNGILLCYWHHKIVDTGPWQYRMVAGVPQVRGPGVREWTPTRKPVAHAA